MAHSISSYLSVPVSLFSLQPVIIVVGSPFSFRIAIKMMYLRMMYINKLGRFIPNLFSNLFNKDKKELNMSALRANAIECIQCWTSKAKLRDSEILVFRC